MVEEHSLELPAHITKNKRARSVPLSITPMLAAMLRPGRKGGKTGRILAEYSIDIIEDACRFLISELQPDEPKLGERLRCQAPKFTPHTLRRSCGTYIVCAPAIYGGATGAALHMAAARLGHSVSVGQKHYIGVIEIPNTAKTIEAAMQLDKLIAKASIPRL
jgi:integrase